MTDCEYCDDRGCITCRVCPDCDHLAIVCACEERPRVWRGGNRHRRAGHNMKRCTRCDLEKPLAEFCVNQATRDGRHYTCRDCQRDAYQARKSENNTPAGGAGRRAAPDDGGVEREERPTR